jgi:hypothetical protein
LWDVLWIASLSARRAKPDCSHIAFEVVLHIEDTTKKYQTLILDIGLGDTQEPVITIGFPADFDHMLCALQATHGITANVWNDRLESRPRKCAPQMRRYFAPGDRNVFTGPDYPEWRNHTTDNEDLTND